MRRPLVILIHGVASVSATMWPLAWWMRRAGFETVYFGYSSLFRNVQFHGNRLLAFLHQKASEDSNREMHIVAHSMGGIVARQALTLGRVPQVKRLVTLASPHAGSPVARWLVNGGLGFIKTLGDVSDAPASAATQLGPVDDVELGTISASYDWSIPRLNSQLAGAVAQIRIFSGHNGLLVRPKAARLTIQFLKTGSFEIQPRLP